MLIEPAKVALYRPIKDVTLNFDTPRKTHENLVFIFTDTYDNYGEAFRGKLFKQILLYNVYTPRFYKPLGVSKLIKQDQSEVYNLIKQKTHGRLSVGKLAINSYQDRNLVYDLIPEYTETLNYYEETRHFQPAKMHDLIATFIPNLIDKTVKDVNYRKAYIIFPLTETLSGSYNQKLGRIAEKDYSLMYAFLRSLKKKTYKSSDYKDIERIFFYNPSNNKVIAADPADPNLIKIFPQLLLRIIKLSGGIATAKDLEISEDEFRAINIDVQEQEPILDKETIYNNQKEEIKDAILKDVGKKLKANLDDYSATSPDEQAIINSIDKKVDSFLSDDKNKDKDANELLNQINKDPEIVRHATSYVQQKIATDDSIKILTKNIQEENKVVDSLDQVYEDTDKVIGYEEIDVDKNLKLSKGISRTSYNNINRDYNNKQANKDKLAVFSAFSNPENIMPITLVDLKFTDSSDAFNTKETATAVYKTDSGRRMTIRIDIPTIIDDYNLYLSGNKYVIGKQLTRLPIVKTETDRVEITTNYQKMTIEKRNATGAVSRRNAYLLKLIEDNSASLKIVYGNSVDANSTYVNDAEYSELGKRYISIDNGSICVICNRTIIKDKIIELDYDYSRFTKEITPFAVDKEKHVYVLDKSVVYKLTLEGNNIKKEKYKDSMFEFFIDDIFKIKNFKYPNVGKSYVYSQVKFISVWYPILVIVAMNIGLQNTLRRAGIKWEFSRTKKEKSFKYVEIPFADGYFYFEDTPIASMLLSVLHSMPTQDYDFIDFNTAEPFADYCVDVLGQPKYVKRMTKINIEKVIDPVTYDVLKTMKLPTDIYGLLLLGSSMMINNDRKPQYDMSGFRIRGNEIIYDVLYSILADAYRSYQQAAMNGSKGGMIVKQNALISELMKTQNVYPASVLNPLLEASEGAKTQAKGFKGINLDQAYKNPETRIFSDSMLGYLSENDTPFSGHVGMSRGLTYDPKITHIRGFFEKQDLNELTSENILSVTELNMFASPTHSDSPRIQMENTQSSKHLMPTKVMSTPLISTGINQTIYKTTGKAFVFRAPEPGVYERYDEKLKLAVLHYDSGTYDAIDLGTHQIKNTASGFYTPNKLTISIKPGERFKKEQVLAYDSNFFQPAHGQVEMLNSCLAKVAIAANDACYEDACSVSEDLCDAETAMVTMAKAVALKRNSNIIKAVKVGDHVHVNDLLLKFTESYEDKSTLDFIAGLSDEDKDLIASNEVLSKFDGEISKIDIYYNVDFDTLSDSIKKYIKEVNAVSNARAQFITSNKISGSNVEVHNSDVKGRTKIDQKEFEGVLIKYYITHADKMSYGDKLTFSVANKGTVSQITEHDKSAISEFRKDNGEIVQAICTPCGVIGRKTISIYFQLYLNKLLVELGRSINDIINDKEPKK